jgi:hypothetical protein
MEISLIFERNFWADRRDFQELLLRVIALNDLTDASNDAE